MKPKQNILLTGASGTVGIEVLQLLIRKYDEYNITVFDVLSHKTKHILNDLKGKINIVFGDITNFEDVRKVCFNKDIVIHLAAIIPPLADEIPEYAYKVNVTGTENLISNLEELSPDAFFMYSSSVSIYGDRVENPEISIDDPLLPSEGDEYAKTKIDAEKIIRNSKLNWTIFRLSAVMGNHKMSKLMFHMPLNTSIEIATPKDTANAFVLGIQNEGLLSGKIFNLGGGSKYRTTYREFLVRSFRIMGLGKMNLPLKAFAERNFHCGFYKDGDDLEKILHFRNGTLEDFYKTMKNATPAINKFLTAIFKELIKLFLLNKSEPYHAIRHHNTQMKIHFFKT